MRADHPHLERAIDKVQDERPLVVALLVAGVVDQVGDVAARRAAV